MTSNEGASLYAVQAPTSDPQKPPDASQATLAGSRTPPDASQATPAGFQSPPDASQVTHAGSRTPQDESKNISATSLGGYGSLDAVSSRKQKTTQHLPMARLGECCVCFTICGDAAGCPTKHCCKCCVCYRCMREIITIKVNCGNPRIPCPNPECDKFIRKDEILKVIGERVELKDKYERLWVEAGGDGNKNTCPRCSLITEHTLPRKLKLKEKDVKLQCAGCGLEWCFKCHAPWHAGATCKAFQTGEKAFNDWSKGTRAETGDANCRQCPICKIYIQRNTGCDHMTCSRCFSEFCYKCGELYIPFTHHLDQLSLLGCKYLYDGHPAERVAVRGGYLAAKLLFLAGYPALWIGGGVLLLIGGIFFLPIYIGYRVHEYRKHKLV